MQKFCMRYVRLEAELEFWEWLARAAEAGLSDEAFRSEVLSAIESFRELLTALDKRG